MFRERNTEDELLLFSGTARPNVVEKSSQKKAEDQPTGLAILGQGCPAQNGRKGRLGGPRNSRGKTKSENRFNLQKGKTHVNSNGPRFQNQDDRMNVQMAKQLRCLAFPSISMLQGLVAMLGWWQFWATTSTSHEARALTTHHVGVQIKMGNRLVSPVAGPQGAPTCKPHASQYALRSLSPGSPHGVVRGLPSTGLRSLASSGG